MSENREVRHTPKSSVEDALLKLSVIRAVESTGQNCPSCLAFALGELSAQMLAQVPDLTEEDKDEFFRQMREEYRQNRDLLSAIKDSMRSTTDEFENESGVGAKKPH